MEHSGSQNYWPSILIVSLAVGFISSILPVTFGYITIGLEPSGSMLQIFLPVLGFCLACLIGALGGLTSVWHYASSYENITISLGRGALIGFLTGLFIVILGVLLEQLLHLLDPNFTANLRDSLIGIIEATDMSESQKQAQIDNIASQYSTGNSLYSAIISFFGGLALYGILNLITGMIGAKIFGKKEEVI